MARVRWPRVEKGLPLLLHCCRSPTSRKAWWNGPVIASQSADWRGNPCPQPSPRADTVRPCVSLRKTSRRAGRPRPAASRQAGPLYRGPSLLPLPAYRERRGGTAVIASQSADWRGNPCPRPSPRADTVRPYERPRSRTRRGGLWPPAIDHPGRGNAAGRGRPALRRDRKIGRASPPPLRGISGKRVQGRIVSAPTKCPNPTPVGAACGRPLLTTRAGETRRGEGAPPYGGTGKWAGQARPLCGAFPGSVCRCGYDPPLRKAPVPHP